LLAELTIIARNVESRKGGPEIDPDDRRKVNRDTHALEWEAA